MRSRRWNVRKIYLLLKYEIFLFLILFYRIVLPDVLPSVHVYTCNTFERHLFLHSLNTRWVLVCYVWLNLAIPILIDDPFFLPSFLPSFLFILSKKKKKNKMKLFREFNPVELIRDYEIDSFSFIIIFFIIIANIIWLRESESSRMDKKRRASIDERNRPWWRKFFTQYKREYIYV